MFGLTPRTQKSSPLPLQEQRYDDVPPSSDAVSAGQEQRLAKALKEVLTKKLIVHRQSAGGSSRPAPANHVDIAARAPGKTTTPAGSAAPGGNGLMAQDGPGFFWLASATRDEDAQSTAKISKRWLKRARRESRMASLRRGTQWILLAGALCAAIAVTLWPSTS